MKNSNLKEISLLLNEANLLLIKIITTAVEAHDQVALNELGIDIDSATKLTKLNDEQIIFISQNYPLVNLSIHSNALKLALEQVSNK